MSLFFLKVNGRERERESNNPSVAGRLLYVPHCGCSRCWQGIHPTSLWWGQLLCYICVVSTHQSFLVRGLLRKTKPCKLHPKANNILLAGRGHDRMALALQAERKRERTSIWVFSVDEKAQLFTSISFMYMMMICEYVCNDSATLLSFF